MDFYQKEGNCFQRVGGLLLKSEQNFIREMVEFYERVDGFYENVWAFIKEQVDFIKEMMDFNSREWTLSKSRLNFINQWFGI